MSEKETNQKYQQIIKASQILFWKHGVKRVSIEEICSLAKVSKMTFYRFFPNKIELAKHLLEKVAKEGFDSYKNLVTSDISFTEKISKLIEMKLESIKNVGQEFILDLYKNPELGLIPFIDELNKESLKLTILFIQKAQKEGFIRKNLKIDFILYFFNQMARMITDNQLIEKYETPQALIMEVTEFFFYGIGAHQDKK